MTDATNLWLKPTPPARTRRAATTAVRLCWLAAVLMLVGGLVPAGAKAAELVMFDRAGCVWCERFDREIGPIYPKTEEGRLAPLRHVDISRARMSGLRLARPVTMTPTFVLIEHGVEIDRLTGYPGEDFFWSSLDQMLAKLPRFRIRKRAPSAPLRDAQARPPDASSGLVAARD
ncbi:MAG: hypothetical protein ACK5JT_16965 [Hyphomicrobiaceae bacterium]